MKVQADYQILMVLVCMIKVNFGVEKFWTPNSEWQTARNWVDNRTPEADSHVIFPLQTRHAVGMGISESVQLAGIELSRSGLLVLPRDGNIRVWINYLTLDLPSS